MPDRKTQILLVALCALGFALTLFVFYPGIMTYDAKYVYIAIHRPPWGDWQSPVMVWLWKLIDPLAPGAASMFLLIAGLYWGGMALLALRLARRSKAAALLLVALAFLPPAAEFTGIIWRDILFSTVWLMAVALTYVAATSASRLNLLLQGAALVLIAFGVLLRPNALIAAPLLIAYALWPARIRFLRIAMVAIPAAAALYGLVQFSYYDLLGAKREHPLHSVFVFDLGGISHFSKHNRFPVTWTPEENALVLDGCYKPTLWDIYWNRDPCNFVMQRLEKREKIFGTPALSSAWLSAIAAHPTAYLQHRAAFMRNFLLNENLTLWTLDVEDPRKYIFEDRPAFLALRAIDESLRKTPLLRAGTWLILDLVIVLLAWRRRDTAEGALAFAAAGSAAIYVTTFFLVGVASDFRYAHWAVLAALTGGAALVTANARPRLGTT
ncbi:MAG: hypothetical protein AB7K35_03695 [Pseudorhodoplanes sp.]